MRLGVHDRGPGPGDTASLPYFTVADLPATLDRVRELGGSVIHPGDRWAVCRDSEGSPFALAGGPAPSDRAGATILGHTHRSLDDVEDAAPVSRIVALTRGVLMRDTA